MPFKSKGSVETYNRSKNHRKPRSKTAVDYVDNKKFYEAIIVHQDRIKEATVKGLPLPKANDYIGDCIIKICRRLASNYNFKSYTFIDDMISDGIMSCTAAVDTKFDPSKSKSPFSYMTECAWFAFVQRINLEEKSNYIKHKNVGNLDMGLMVEMDGFDQEAHHSVISDFEEKLARFKEKKIERERLEALEAKRKSRKRKSLKKIIDEEE